MAKLMHLITKVKLVCMQSAWMSNNWLVQAK